MIQKISDWIAMTDAIYLKIMTKLSIITGLVKSPVRPLVWDMYL